MLRLEPARPCFRQMRNCDKTGWLWKGCGSPRCRRHGSARPLGWAASRSTGWPVPCCRPPRRARDREFSAVESNCSPSSVRSYFRLEGVSRIKISHVHLWSFKSSFRIDTFGNEEFVAGVNGIDVQTSHSHQEHPEPSVSTSGERDESSG